MFYSYEVLTQRKYGVATVWLVATLGSKSSNKKIGKKAILEVDISKACRTVSDPVAPMALRLQSNLLFGISRVYSQQCGFVLADAQTAQNNMRVVLKALRTAGLDPDAGKARPDQLVLQDDPAFLPDFMPRLDLDLSALEISTQGSSKRSSLMSAHSLQSSCSSQQDAGASVLGLLVPETAGNNSAVGPDGFAAAEWDRVARDRRLSWNPEEQIGFLPDVDFHFDAEGNMIETGPDPAIEPGATPALPRGRSDSLARARVRREQEEGFLAGQQALGEAMDLDPDIPYTDEAGQFLPPAEPFSELGATDRGRLSAQQAPVEATEEHSEYAEAAQIRRPRVRKTIQPDPSQELGNRDLRNWQTNYLANMEEARRQSLQAKLTALAKKNAAYWVYGRGLNGAGEGMGQDRLPLPAPLQMFAGEKLRGWLAGIPSATSNRKRGRSAEHPSSGDEQRRVRLRSSDDDDGAPQIGRGDRSSPLEVSGLQPLHDDDIELGRDAGASLLEDYSAQMPWNILSSARGSRQASHAGSLVPRGLSSAGPPSSLPPPTSFDRRTSRFTGASPSLGRGRASDLSPGLLRAMSTNASDAGVYEDTAAAEDFELFGPAAGVSTQTAGQGDWVSGALEQESRNFLEFVRLRLDEERAHLESETTAGQPVLETITFEDLLPPGGNSRVVASQAFLHVLVLATRGALAVDQAGQGLTASIRIALVADAATATA